MPMQLKGLAKLTEELGELNQVVGKVLAYPEILSGSLHVDGITNLETFEDEIADVIAAITFVVDKHALNRSRIERRMARKLELYERWDAE